MTLVGEVISAKFSQTMGTVVLNVGGGAGRTEGATIEISFHPPDRMGRPMPGDRFTISIEPTRTGDPYRSKP